MKKKAKAKKNGGAKAGAKKKDPSAAQVAHQVTWQLLGSLKRERLNCIHIGALLAKVRDEKMYADLKFPNIEEYAKDRLKLGRTSLYKYLRVYDWILKNHPEWTQPNVKGFIPDLNDVDGLIWMDAELERKDLTPAKRAALEALQKKGLNGTLRQSDLTPLRRKERNTAADGLRSFLSKLRNLRTRGSKLANMPTEVLAQLDAAIAILKNDNVLQLAGLDRLQTGGWDVEQTQIA